MTTPEPLHVARIEGLKVQNFRALKAVDLKELTPMTVLVGPNGSGKSTVFDVFAFLSECFEFGLRRAWDRRGRARQLRTRGSDQPIAIELQYRERPKSQGGRRKSPRITYHLSIDERKGVPVIVHEWLQWRRQRYGRPYRFLEYREGEGAATTGETPDSEDQRVESSLNSPDLLAVNALGQFEQHPRVAALRDFIMGWHVSHFSTSSAHHQPEAGPHERLTKDGDNLANVIQFLAEQHPRRLESIFEALRRRVPRVERVSADTMPDGRLLLQVKDAPFKDPVMARYVSDGTLKMLAYLALLRDPKPPPFIGIEEPENFLHPRLLPGLAEECRQACEQTQLLITTHSPFFISTLRPEEVRVLWRNENGHTQAERVADRRGVREFITEGAHLGALWMEGHFGVGDPLVRQGGPVLGADGR